MQKNIVGTYIKSWKGKNNFTWLKPGEFVADIQY